MDVVAQSTYLARWNVLPFCLFSPTVKYIGKKAQGPVDITDFLKFLYSPVNCFSHWFGCLWSEWDGCYTCGLSGSCCLSFCLPVFFFFPPSLAVICTGSLRKRHGFNENLSNLHNVYLPCRASVHHPLITEVLWLCPRDVLDPSDVDLLTFLCLLWNNTMSAASHLVKVQWLIHLLRGSMYSLGLCKWHHIGVVSLTCIKLLICSCNSFSIAKKQKKIPESKWEASHVIRKVLAICP